jgi:hypothetical protein
MNIKTPYNNGLTCRNRYIYNIRYEETISSNPYVEIDIPEKILKSNQLVVKYLDQLLEHDKHYNLNDDLSKLILIKVFIPVPNLKARDSVEIYIYAAS